MEKKKHNIRIDQDGNRHAPVPIWQELPQITVALKKEIPPTALPVALMENTHFPKKW